MTTLDEWTAAACAALGLDPAEASPHLRLILDLARDAARAVERPAAPISTYLLGLAVGRGADLAQAAATLTELAQARQESQSGSRSGPQPGTSPV